MPFVFKFVIFSLSILIATFSYAEDIFESDSYELEPLLTDKSLDISAELGALFTTGNSESTSIFWKVAVKHEIESWRVKYSFESLFKQDELTDNETGQQITKTSAEKYLLNAEANYEMTEKKSLFVFAGSDFDRFGAYRSITSLVAGYSFRAIDGSLISWDLNIAPGFTRVEEQQQSSESAPVLRASSAFQWLVNSHAKLSQNTSIEASSINTRVIIEAAVAAKLHGSMLMKVAFKATSNDDVKEGLAHTDTSTSVTLVVNF